MSFRPDKNIQKLLISSTSRFVGEYEDENLFVGHAWPSMLDRSARFRDQSSPLSRSAYIVAFKTNPNTEAPGFIIPTYEGVGENVCAILSLLFGKRFDFHGGLETSGFFGLPDLSHFSHFSEPSQPFNNHDVRDDLSIPLNLVEVRRVTPLLYGKIEEKKLTSFMTATQFYHRALSVAEDDPESAYLHLITAGEILAEALHTPGISLQNPKTEAVFVRIQNEMPDGVKIAKYLRSQMRGIKKQFCASIINQIDNDFFKRREQLVQWDLFQRNGFKDAIAAAYDLRSRFVHTGFSFGSWVRARGSYSERQSGVPVLRDKKMAKTIHRAPTLNGLESVMRYALLKHAGNLGIDIAVEASNEILSPEIPITLN
jgi:Apea-like HEPN